MDATTSNAPSLCASDLHTSPTPPTCAAGSATTSFYDAIEMLSSTGGNHTSMLKALVDLPGQSELKQRLNSTSLSTGTLLAPSNAAFEAFLADLSADDETLQVADLDGDDRPDLRSQVSRLITFHSLISTIPARDFPAPDASEDHVSLLPT